MFRIDNQQNIHLTQGDTAELDLRIFNKSHGYITYKYSNKPSQALRDSEGKLILDEEGHPIWPNYTPKQEWHPSKYHQEEEILGDMEFILTDMGNEVMLEKHNDEFPNSIFFDAEDTESLQPGMYYFAITYREDESDEVQTVHTGIMEICDK